MTATKHQGVFYEEESAESWSHPGEGLASTALRKTLTVLPIPVAASRCAEIVLLADTARCADETGCPLWGVLSPSRDLEACLLKNIAKRLTEDWMVVSAMAETQISHRGFRILSIWGH